MPEETIRLLEEFRTTARDARTQGKACWLFYRIRDLLPMGELEALYAAWTRCHADPRSPAELDAEIDRLVGKTPPRAERMEAQ